LIIIRVDKPFEGIACQPFEILEIVTAKNFKNRMVGIDQLFGSLGLTAIPHNPPSAPPGKFAP